MSNTPVSVAQAAVALDTRGEEPLQAVACTVMHTGSMCIAEGVTLLPRGDWLARALLCSPSRAVVGCDGDVVHIVRAQLREQVSKAGEVDEGLALEFAARPRQPSTPITRAAAACLQRALFSAAS